MFDKASLLLATSAVFLTTPPPRESIINYTLRGPYTCVLVSFGLLLGGIIVASVCILVLTVARPYWSEKVCTFSADLERNSETQHYRYYTLTASMCTAHFL